MRLAYRSGVQGVQLSIVLFLAFAGCRPADQPAHDPAHPRLVSLAPNLTEIICALDGMGQLAGRSSACNYPATLKGKVAIVGDFGVPSLERIVATHPAAVLYTDLADISLDLKLRRAGLNPIHVACSRLDDIPEAITRVGALLHREPNARRLAGSLRERIAAARAAIPTGPAPRVLVLIWNDPLTAAGRGTFISDLITLAGGRNIGDEINRDYFQVSREWVLARDPEVIFCFFMANDKPVRQLVLNMPGWERLTAVRQSRVFDGFDNDLVVRPGPRVMEGLALIRPHIRMDSAPGVGQTSAPTP